MNPQEYKQQLLDSLYEPYKRNGMPYPLAQLGCTKIVFGEGNADADLMFIGEAPGKEEDLQGRPFVGRSGQLLDRALRHVGIERSETYITNIVKCRPPNNRAPTPLEASTCMNLLLFNQIKIIRPKIICTLGSIALNNLIGKPCSITKMRGAPLEWKEMTIVPLFHPAYILRNQKMGSVWIEDFKKVKSLIGK